MNDFEAYKQYVALKNHFKSGSSYDYFKYQGKNRLNIDSFNKRKDKVFFQKLAKHSDLTNFLVANFIKDSKIWVRELAYSKDCESIYQTWIKDKQSLTYRFKSDISKLQDNFNSNFIVRDNEHPFIIKEYMGGEISFETFCILVELSSVEKYWDSKLEYDIMWNELKHKYKKYIGFLELDTEKFKQLCLDRFIEQ